MKRLALVLLLAGLVTVVWLAIDWEPRLLPIRVVTIDGELRSLSREQLQATVAHSIRGGILTQDIEALRTQLEAMPWVRRVRLRRIWPDRLELEITEQQAVARWGANGLITADAQIFYPDDGRVPAGLVRLGDTDDEAARILEYYFHWEPQLAELGLLVESLRRDLRGDWTVQLLGDTELLLGTNHIESRLQRLLTVYPRLSEVGIPVRIDLRYSNGMAVRWRTSPNDVSRGKRMAALTGCSGAEC